MGWIIGLLPGGQMALRVSAIRGANRQVVVVVDMAGCARDIGVAVGEQKSCGSMIKVRGVPTNRGVAIGTVRNGKRRAGRGVRGIIRLLPGGQVALRISAIRRRNLKVVVVVDVAGRASHVGVTVGEREPRGVMVELCA